jgi:transposase
MSKTKNNECHQHPQTQAVKPPVVIPPKRYDEPFKRQAVEHWIQSGKSGTQIAAELGISYPSLKDWKRRYVGDATPARADLEAENRALRAELARVREQRDILKKTLGILSEPSKNATSGSKS